VDWVPGWEPLLVITESGVAEPDCVFVTPASPRDAIWLVTRHDPAGGFLEIVKVSPGVTVCRLTVQLRAEGAGCEAAITYSHTSLGPVGDELCAAFTEEHYERFMRDWEVRLGHFLSTGSMLRD
jgi:hypothetical protein